MRAIGILSPALLVVFLISTFTEIGLWFVTHGRGSSYWTFFGIPKENLRPYHRISSVVFVIPAFAHPAINFKVLLAELRTMVKK